MTQTKVRAIVIIGLIGALSGLAGCASPHRLLMPTPQLYSEPASIALFDETPEERQRSEVDLLYITDRQPETGSRSGLPYGQQRSRSIAFGEAAVSIGQGMTWSELVEHSQSAKRSERVTMEMGAVRETGRFPDEPYELEVTSQGVQRSRDVVERHETTRAAFEVDLQDRLERSADGEVILYIHGFNETFETAAFTTAELCHFFGREDVCAFFTWPAASTGNMLTRYAGTTESADYAVGHLVKSIRLIAQTPGLRSIQILAHSRGSALLLSALRELALQAVAAGIEPAAAYRIDNVVLLSPDIDADVARQKIELIGSDPDLVSRWSQERLPRFINGRLTIYASPSDRALRASTALFRSRVRVGRFAADGLPEEARAHFGAWEKIDFVIYQGKATDRFGHSYFASNPAVSADLVQLIRFQRAPGEAGRALVPKGEAIWTFPDASG